MITLEDVLEELVGEIHDEYDRLPSHINRAGPGWILGGNASLERIQQETGIELGSTDEAPIHTLNDWVVRQLGRPARSGDQIASGEARLLVRKVRRQLVQEAMLTREQQ
jgi:putative hemolysin